MSAIINNKCITTSYLKITNFSLQDLTNDTFLPRIKVNWGTISGLIPKDMPQIYDNDDGLYLQIFEDSHVYACAEYDLIEKKWQNAQIITTSIDNMWEKEPLQKDTPYIQYYYKLIGTILLKQGAIYKIITHSGNVDFQLKPINKDIPLDIIDATEKSGKTQVRIKWGTIANLQPEGFAIGDFPRYYLPIKESGYIYACAELDPEKIIWTKSWILFSKEKIYSTSKIVYKLIGSVLVYNGNIINIASCSNGNVELGLQDLNLNE